MSALFLAFVSALLLGGYEIARKAAVAKDTAERMLVTATTAGALTLVPIVLLSILAPDVAASADLTVRWLSPTRAHARLGQSDPRHWRLDLCLRGHCAPAAQRVASPLRATSPGLHTAGRHSAVRRTPGSARVAPGCSSSSPATSASPGSVRRKVSTTARALGWPLLGFGLFLSAASGLYDKYLLQEVLLPPTTLQFWFLAYGSVLQWFFMRFKERGSERKPFRIEHRALLAGLFLALADQFYLRSLAIPGAMVALIALVRRSSLLVSFTLGGLLFREKLLLQKAAPLTLIFVGLGLLLWR